MQNRRILLVLEITEYEDLIEFLGTPILTDNDEETPDWGDVLRNARVDPDGLVTVKVTHSNAKYLTTDVIDLVDSWDVDQHNNLHLTNAAGDTTVSYRNWESVTSVPEVEDEEEEDEQSD